MQQDVQQITDHGQKFNHTTNYHTNWELVVFNSVHTESENFEFSELMLTNMTEKCNSSGVKDHTTRIFKIQVTQFLKLILQKVDLPRLLSLKILRR